MIDHPLILFGLFPLAGYVIGSTPFGVLLGRARGVDLRKVGSGNIGATNVGRALGRSWGCLCFVLDVAKGLVPVLIAGRLVCSGQDVPTPAQQGGLLAAGFGAIAGHVFSFYLRGRGGKGVATSLGMVLGIWPYFTLPGAAALGVWILVTLATRYISLGSIAAAVAFVPLVLGFNWTNARKLWPLGMAAVAIAALIIIRHVGNIRRLLAGTESRIGHKPPPSDTEGNAD